MSWIKKYFIINVAFFFLIAIQMDKKISFVPYVATSISMETLSEGAMRCFELFLPII
jgi:hypothetical protein